MAKQKYPERTGFLYRDEPEIFKLVEQWPVEERIYVEWGYREPCLAFQGHNPRMTGEPAVEHPITVGNEVITELLIPAGDRNGKKAAAAFMHDNIEDIDTSIPWKNRMDGYRALPILYGSESLARMLFFLSRGRGQNEVEHLEQIREGRDVYYATANPGWKAPPFDEDFDLQGCREIKVRDRIHNMRTYPLVYSAPKLTIKLGLSVEYYVPFSETAIEFAQRLTPAMVLPLERQHSLLLEQIAISRKHLKLLETSRAYRTTHFMCRRTGNHNWFREHVLALETV